MNQRAIVVLSGGQDSTTCLFWALHNEYDVHCLTIDYGQRHAIEINAAIKVRKCAEETFNYEIDHDIVSVGKILQGTSPLVSSVEKLEQYKDMYSLPGGLEKTFVPMRNQLFLTIAANRAVVLDRHTIITGVCEEDYGGYPDCRRTFIDTLEEAINRGSFVEPNLSQLIHIETPLMNLTKKRTVELAMAIPGCYEALAWTHTSYDGTYPPTGKDHATLLRAKGFFEAGVPDPLVVRAYHDNLMDLPNTKNYSPEAFQKFPLLYQGSPVDSVKRFR